MEKYKLENCLHCNAGLFSCIFIDFLYFDTKEGFSKQMLKDQKVKMWSLKKATIPGEPYELYIARVWKWDVVKFVDVMERLEKRILFAGNGNYLDYCKQLFGKFNGGSYRVPERQ